ncbi:HNH endonuclease [Bacillus cereus]|nr:HNH endonuclease [Bacillus cereus]
MKNQFRHNEDGTTSIFMTYLDEELKTTISTVKFEEVSSIDGKWFTWWDFDSRTYYVAYKKSGHTVYLHRFITDCPKGMQVHHKDGNGLNNTNGNLVNVTCKEHNQENMAKAREPFTGDPSLGIELHILLNAVNRCSNKRYLRLKINGIPFKSICDNREGHLMKWIANEIMNCNTTDKQIYTYLSRAGYHDKDMITKHINWVRKYIRVPDPSVPTQLVLSIE